MNTEEQIQEYMYDTVYENERYKVPYSLMGSWYAYMKSLSIFTLDAGHEQIAFHDAFNKYKTIKQCKS